MQISSRPQMETEKSELQLTIINDFDANLSQMIVKMTNLEQALKPKVVQLQGTHAGAAYSINLPGTPPSAEYRAVVELQAMLSDHLLQLDYYLSL